MFPQFLYNYSIVTSWVYMNDVTNGMAMPFFLSMFFIVCLGTFLYAGFPKAMTISSLVCFIVATFFWSVGLIEDSFFWIAVGLLLLSAIIFYFMES